MTLKLVGHDLALGGPDDRRVVRTGQSTVGGDGDEADAAYVGGLAQQRVMRLGTAGREVLDDLGDLTAIGLCRGGTLLCLDDTRGRDELHGARDLLR